MAGRGRGGGGGRGRGRGTMSFDVGQLGFGVGEQLPGPVLQPPPTYPPLEHRPAPLKTDAEGTYMVALKRYFVEHLKAHMFVQTEEKITTIERFSDKYNVLNSGQKEKWDTHFDWSLLPSELKPKIGRRGIKRKKNQDAASKKKMDVVAKLEKLASQEKSKENEDSDSETKENEEKDEDEEENPEELEAEDLDDEMDLGTDYVNNYFDNGEGYLDDDDDNMDDGPVY